MSRKALWSFQGGQQSFRNQIMDQRNKIWDILVEYKRVHVEINNPNAPKTCTCLSFVWQYFVCFVLNTIMYSNTFLEEWTQTSSCDTETCQQLKKSKKCNGVQSYLSCVGRLNVLPAKTRHHLRGERKWDKMIINAAKGSLESYHPMSRPNHLFRRRLPHAC